MRHSYLIPVILLLGGASVWAQEKPLAEEKAWDKAALEARAASAEAWKLIEKYGRGMPV
jgi:hypothetical protein